jgi:hypothetical protein
MADKYGKSESKYYSAHCQDNLDFETNIAIKAVLTARNASNIF